MSETLLIQMAMFAGLVLLFAITFAGVLAISILLDMLGFVRLISIVTGIIVGTLAIETVRLLFFTG